MISHIFSPTRRTASCVAAVITAGFLAGCASSARFSVEARHVPGAVVDAASYRLETGPALRATTASGVSREQVLRDVRTALSAHGLFEAPAGLAADLAIEVDFAIGQPYEKALTMAAPVYAEGASAASGGAANGRIGASASGSPTKVGEREVTRIVTVFPKRLELTAWAAQGRSVARTSDPLWRVAVDNVDEGNDLARYTRWMVAAAMDWVGRDTTEPIEIVLGSRDQRVTFIAAGETHAPNGGVVAGRTERAATGRPVDG